MDKEELINGYFENSLTPHQIKELENLYRTDKEFASQLDYEKEIKQALRANERNELKNMFAQISKEEQPPSRKKPLVVQLRPMMMAASIALLVGIGSWLLFFNTPNASPEELYQIHFAPYENVVHPIERGAQIEDLKTRAFTAYENEEYQTALGLFKELQQKSTDSFIIFYEAIVLMQLQRQADAIPLFKDYISTNGDLKVRAQWYLSLCYLKTEQLELSRRLWMELVGQGEFKSKEAAELLKRFE